MKYNKSLRVIHLAQKWNIINP